MSSKKEKEWTEEDTFRILARPSYEELNRAYQELGKLGHTLNLRKKEEFFLQHKWTRREYLTERRKRFNGDIDFARLYQTTIR